MSDTVVPAETVTPPADTAPAPAPSPTPPAPAPAPAAPTAPQVADPADVDAELPADADVFSRAYVEKLRRKQAEYRTSASAAEQAKAAAEAQAAEKAADADAKAALLAQIQQALNPDAPTEEAPDPAKLTEQLTAAEQARAAEKQAYETQIRELQVKAALPNVAAALNLDASLTTAVLTASGALGKLDPSAETFTADLESAMKAAAEIHPSLRVAPVVTTTGTEPTGRSGATNQITREQLQGMSHDEIVKAQKEGRLTSLLGGG